MFCVIEIFIDYDADKFLVRSQSNVLDLKLILTFIKMLLVSGIGCDLLLLYGGIKMDRFFGVKLVLLHSGLNIATFLPRIFLIFLLNN